MKNLTTFSVILFLLFNFQNLTAQTAPGGFTDQWANYPAGVFGSVNISLNHTGLRNIEAVPAAGEHPRIFFNASEIPTIKSNLENSTSGQEVFKQIHAYTTLLNLGYIANGYNHNASYGSDAFGNKRIDNAGHWDSHNYYYDLIAGVPTALDAADTKRRYLLASVMALEAFECMIKAGETDPDTGLDYDDRAVNLGQAMSNWAQIVIGDPDLDWTNYNMFGGSFMAMCYDLNYNNMTTAQRDSVRMGLAAIIPAEPRYGSETTYYATTSNWVGLNSFEILTNFAIEDEMGYNPTLTEDYMRAYRNFLTYGWYASGTPYEGLGKNYQFVTTLIAAAKRGYSLLGHPYVKSYGQNFLPAIMQPYGHSFIGTDVWGGTGWDVEIGGYKFHPNDIVGLKWMLPSDSKINFVWRNYIEEWYKINSTGYVYQQILPTSNGYHPQLLLAAIFAEDYSSGDWTTQNQNTLGGLSFLAPERGLSILRSGYDQDALMAHFHCRQDLGGHTHGDRNGFAFSALDRIWFRYTFGSAFQETQYHSCLLVDDLGVKVTNLEGKKCRQPGTILDFSDDGTLAKIAGDATYAYSWEWHWQSRPPNQDHSWLGTGNWEKVLENWNDFRYQTGTETFHNTPFYDYDNWNNAGDLERIIKQPYNPMERVYRTMSMIRGANPFMLIVDDVQKDAAVHNYKWLGQVASDLTIESFDVNLVDSDYRCDVILKDNSNKRLLVRILQNDGYSGVGDPASLVDVTPGINGNNPVSRLTIEADVVAPNFKVMLFPHYDGDDLPTTQWNADKTQLTVIFGNVAQVFNLPVTNGRTDINLLTTSVLEVDLTQFTTHSHQKDIQLKWRTASEINSKKFEIERSDDGFEFRKIGEVVAAGNSNSLKNYQFIDSNVDAGKLYYYRLKQFDFDGNFEYSNIETARLAHEFQLVNISPQPFDDYFDVEFSTEKISDLTFQIRNLEGKIIFKENFKSGIGKQSLKIDGQDWVKGIYFLEVVGKNYVKRFKLVKQ